MEEAKRTGFENDPTSAIDPKQTNASALPQVPRPVHSHDQCRSVEL